MAKHQSSRYRAKPLERRWEPFIATDPLIAALDRDHLATGYRRAPRVRGSFRSGRILTLRFTWSKFLNGVRLEVSHIVQVDIAAPKEVTP